MTRLILKRKLEIAHVVLQFYCEISRKKPLLLVSETVSSLFRLVGLSVGESVMLDHEIRSGLCCNTKFVEGTIQESPTLPVGVVIFNCGDGEENKVYIPEFVPKNPTDATSLAPSAEEATLVHQTLLGALFDIHVAPEFVVV